MLRSALTAIALLLAIAAPAAADLSVGLDGSRSSMVRQHRIAEENDYSFLRTAEEVHRFVENGYLVPVEGNADYEVLDGVSFPVARPELRTFIERLSAQHRAACGQKLVVTSLTRPTSDQPWNSHPLSVHPAGMAVDLRVLDAADCRTWLEETLLSLEREELLDVTREYHPPHYHVAVFPTAYREYVSRLVAADSARAAAERREREKALEAAAVARLAAATRQSFLPADGREVPESGSTTDWRALVAIPVALAAIALGFARGKCPTRRRQD
jgi:hypothetical protein